MGTSAFESLVVPAFFATFGPIVFGAAYLGLVRAASAVGQRMASELRPRETARLAARWGR